MKKKVVSMFSVLIIILMVFSTFTPSKVTAQLAEPNYEVKVDQAVLDDMQTKGSASYWIQFKNDADLSPAFSMNWSDRGWFVYKTLVAQAEATQTPVQKYLVNSKIDHKSYWINNSMLVTSSTISVLNEIIKFDGVESIQARKSYMLYEPDTTAALLDNGVNAIEPNLTHVNADDVWTLGIDGAGLVVANIDTGVRYSHQALVGQYRGNLGGGTFDHNYNWFNPDDLGDDVPRDGNGHGTHTMGTMVGDDGSANQIGIAPGAEWMACAGCPDGGCTDTALLGCAEFVAAPTDLSGANADPDLRPNAVNNSWGDCGTTYDNWFAGVISAWHAVGTYPIFSNGNASNCGYSAPPGLNTVGNPARSGNVTGVGSSGEQNGQYATHSNWGPTDNLDTVNPVDTFANMKPQVLAPGVSIRSSVPGSDTSYEDGWTGTSMSAPHVTGLVALIWQAAPCLVGEYAITESLIESTAVDMVYDDGSALTPTNFPNFATGWGEIDALAAVNMASGMCAMGTLEGTVTTDGFAPVEGAKIFADNGAGYTKNIYSAANGSYSSGLPDGTYTLTASKYGYQSQTVTGVVVTEDATTMQDFVIAQLGMSLISGNVYDGGVEGLGSHGYPLYSSIHITTPGFDETIYTDPFTGYYEIEVVEDTELSFTTQPVPGGYAPLVESVTATGATYTHDIYIPVDGEVCAAPGYQPDYDIFFSFESGNEGFTPGGTTSFAWGDFTSGPMAGHSGTKGIATNPAGLYNASELGWMVSPVIDLSGFGSNTPVVEWWDWKDIENVSYDWARLDVTKDGGVTWTTVWGPVGGVSDTAYNKQTVILDPSYNVSDFQMRFYFKSDISIQYEGWYVDDIGIFGFAAPTETVVFEEDFNDTDGAFVPTGTPTVEWQWGVPSTTFPGPCPDGNCWDTNLAGNYSASTNQTLTSPAIDLSGVVLPPGNSLYLKWWQAAHVENNSWDDAWAEISADGTTWTTMWANPGSTITEQWNQKAYDVSSYVGEDSVYLRFRLTSDTSVHYEGYSIDHIKISYQEPIIVPSPECTIIPGGVVAGYVYDELADLPLVGADVYSDVVQTQTFFIPEDPASEGLYWAFQPTADDPEDVVFTAEKNLYGSEIETVSVSQDEINQQDFYLGTGQLSFDPDSFEVNMFMGDEPLTETLTISNLGTSNATFELVEKDQGFELPMLTIPAFTGELPEDTRPVSMGRAPEAADISALSTSKNNPFEGLLAGAPAFAVDAYPGENLVYFPDTTVPGTWTIVGGLAGTEFFAGDFVGGDYDTLYVINSTGNTLYGVNTATAATTMIGTATPPAGQSFSGLSGTPYGEMYGLTTTCAGTNLVTVDITTGATTDLGALPGIDCGIDLAYNTDDDMIYIVDLVTDSLFKVDPATVTVTLVGLLGASPNYAQGMDFEEESGVLYWAAYTTAGELRIIDTTTGASTLVGAFPGGAEVDSLAFATGGSMDVPWLSEDPVSGIVTPETPVEVTITFDPTGAGLSQPGDYLAALKIKHETPYVYPDIPVVLHLSAPGSFGTFNGHVFGMEACDVNPTALQGATVNFWQDGMVKYTTSTNSEGYYSYAVPEGTYDIEVMADGFISQLIFGQAVAGGETITNDFDLRLEAPCISVDPTSLEQSQVTNTITTQTLTIMNTGAGDGTFELIELPVSSLLLDQLLQDPSFEAYTPNPYWDEYSETYGTPLCTIDDCGTGTGTGPNTGDVWSWFGGSSTGDVGYVSQEVLMLPGTAEMTFYVEQYVCGSAGVSNYMALKIDGTELWRTDGTDPACGVLGYRLVTVDVTDFADGDTHEIMFDSVAVDGANFFLDDVELNLEAGGDIPWLSLDPMAGSVPADDSVDVTVTYDSTGLALGDYFGSIRVKNQPAAAINIPVTLHVSDVRNIYLPLILR